MGERVRGERFPEARACVPGRGCVWLGCWAGKPVWLRVWPGRSPGWGEGAHVPRVPSVGAPARTCARVRARVRACASACACAVCSVVCTLAVGAGT